MAYTKKTWVSGETPLSAENMNNIENGIANAHEDISELNTKLLGSFNSVAYVTFQKANNNYWISSPISLPYAEGYNIALYDNVKIAGGSTSEISQTLFAVHTSKHQFCLVTNDTAVAGYIFGTSAPNYTWEVYYSVRKK